MSTTTGATLTSDNVLNTLREQNEQIAMRKQQRLEAQASREKRAAGHQADREETSRKRQER